MTKKKQKTTMLVRDVPVDVSERIRRFCRKEGIRYREFLEKAIDQFEGANQENGKDPGQEERVQEKAESVDRVAEITEKVKAFKNAIRLRKDLDAISENIGFLADLENQPHVYLEVVRMEKELDEIMKKYIPKYDIPDDLKKRKAMGLPDLYCLNIVPVEESEEIKGHNEEAGTRWEMSEEEIREEFRRLNQKSSAENLMAGLKPDEDSAKPLTRKDEGQRRPRAAATAEPYQGPAKDEAEAAPEKKGIKATGSETGVDDGGEE